MFVPVCDTTLSASSRAPLSCYYIDLTASRKLHFYQLLVARSENLLFISGVIFPPFSSISFSLICVLSPSTTWICKRKSEFLSPELVRPEDLDINGASNLFNISSLSFSVCILILISQLISRSRQTQYGALATLWSFYLVGFILANGAYISTTLINKTKEVLSLTFPCNWVEIIAIFDDCFSHFS